jgi:hypothetical protein
MDLATGNPSHAKAEILRRFRSSRGRRRASGATEEDRTRRTVGQLRDAADEIATHRRQRALERAAEERSRRECEQAEARKKHLEALARREDAAWRQVDDLIATRKPKEYDQAVALLKDLKEVAKKNGTTRAAKSRVRQLRRAHEKKSTLIARFDAAGL